MTHKFSIGQTVAFQAPGRGVQAAIGTYEVTRLLPSDGEVLQYRIKSLRESHERIAREDQLTRSR